MPAPNVKISVTGPPLPGGLIIGAYEPDSYRPRFYGTDDYEAAVIQLIGEMRPLGVEVDSILQDLARRWLDRFNIQPANPRVEVPTGPVRFRVREPRKNPFGYGLDERDQ